MEKYYLKLKVIWKDEHLIELQINANNGEFSGITEAYNNKDSLIEFSNKIKGFPSKSNSKKIIHEIGQENSSFGYCKMSYYQINDLGKVGVQIILENKLATAYRKEEKCRLIMELAVEPNAIHRFQQKLSRLVKNEDGEAILLGIPKHL